MHSHDARSLLSEANNIVRTTLTNVDDMAFTGSLSISGERVHPIIDTGSFEIVIFKKRCKGCTDTSSYFDPTASASDYEPTKLTAKQSYGSGETTSTAVFANVRMTDGADNAKVKKQVFWLASEVDMNFKVSGEFSGVFGLGPPASALSFAQDDLAYVKDAVARSGGSDNRVEAVLETMELVVELENKTKPWLFNADCRVFSVCIKPGYGQNGVLVLNDVVPGGKRWIETDGDFWQVPIKHVAIAKTKHTARGNSKCSAILDSGTSLIGVPSDFLNAVTREIETLVRERGCDDLSSWPKFEFTFGDRPLTLHPSSYVANYDFSFKTVTPSITKATTLRDKKVALTSDKVARFLPHLDRFLDLAQNLTGYATGVAGSSFSAPVCAPALFAMDSSDSTSDCEFLFGLPLFREYYTSHKTDNDGRPDSMMFSKADDQCIVSGKTSDMHASHKPRAPLLVDPRRLLFPSKALGRRRSRAN